MSDTVWLVGDIGGTNARFGLVAPDGSVRHTHIFPIGEFATIGDAIEAYLGQRGDLPMPHQAALAIAGPVSGDRVRMTNHPWNFSIAELRNRLGLDRLEVINDFTAVALAVPRLGPGDRMQIGGGVAIAGRPIGILGPGSGLGVSGLVQSGGRWVPLAGEGGHATMSAATERESAVLSEMRRQFDHVSAERCLSGPGLVNLYNGLAAVDGVPSAGYTAAQITDPETGASDPLVSEATAMF
jgi:glucokinase